MLPCKFPLAGWQSYSCHSAQPSCKLQVATFRKTFHRITVTLTSTPCLQVVLFAHDPRGDAVDRLRVEVDGGDHHAVPTPTALAAVPVGGVESQGGERGCGGGINSFLSGYYSGLQPETQLFQIVSAERQLFRHKQSFWKRHSISAEIACFTRITLFRPVSAEYSASAKIKACRNAKTVKILFLTRTFPLYHFCSRCMLRTE